MASELPADLTARPSSDPGESSRVVTDPNPAVEGAPAAVPEPIGSLISQLARRVRAAPGAPTITTSAPFTGRPLATLPRSSAEDVATAVAGARAAQPAWAARPVRDRARVLLALHDLILARRGEILDVVQLETGKARIHAFEEVADVAINARHYARRGPRLLAEAARGGLIPGLTRVTEVRHPRGVVGIIAPWNYPLSLAVADALPALLAGNAVVLKPDSQTPLTALWGAWLLEQAGLPEGLFQIVVGEGPVVGTALVGAADYVCFTGSTATGRIVAQQAAVRLVGASLELGGKNGCYVAEDADLDRAAEGVVRDCFTSAGQLCVSMERIVVHQAVADAFLDRFVDRVRRLRLGSSLDYTAEMGSLISPAQLERVSAHVDDAVAHGATVLAGGRHRPDLGPLFYEPTVLGGVPTGARCYGEETFGPVVSVYRAASDDEAVRLINDTEYGLNAAVWTRDTRRGARIARRLRTGTVSVNEAYIATWGSVGAPMGGRGDSGLGRRHGREGLLRFTESQTVAVQHAPGVGRLYALGQERFATTFTGLLRTAGRTRFPWP